MIVLVHIPAYKALKLVKIPRNLASPAFRSKNIQKDGIDILRSSTNNAIGRGKNFETPKDQHLITSQPTSYKSNSIADSKNKDVEDYGVKDKRENRRNQNLLFLPIQWSGKYITQN